MPCKSIPEIGYVVVAALACVVRRVQGNSEVDTHDKEIKVVAESESGVKGYLLGKFAQLELSSGAALLFLQQPHIAGIYKQCAVQVAEHVETVFGVCFKFQGTGLVKVRVACGLRGARRELFRRG